MASEGGDPAAAAPPPASADAGAVDLPDSAALEFGWVPAEVVHALLEEVGNFRARAAAIELLHAAVLEAAAEPATVLPTLSAFLSFLLRLVADANFKIAISAMTILEDLVAPLGAGVQPYLGTLTAPLIERLGDNVQMVRQAASRAIAALARSLGPAPVLAALGSALVHPSWRVREEGVNAYTAALLSHPKERFDYPTCVRALAGAAADETPRVAAAALEAFALLHARLGALLQGLLTAVGAPDPVKKAVAERIRQAPALGLPGLDAQGNMQHQAHARPPSAQRSKSAPTAGMAAAAFAAAAHQRQQATPGSASTTAMVGAAGGSPVVSGNALALAPRSPLVGGAGSTAMPMSGPELSGVSATLTTQSWQPRAPVAAAAAEAAYSPAFIPAVAPDASSGYYAEAASTYAFAGEPAAGAYVEASAPSYASSSSIASRASYVSHGAAAGGWDMPNGGQEVERSEGSLLNWQRPARRPNQASFTGPSGSRVASAVGGGGLVATGSAAFSRTGTTEKQMQQHDVQGRGSMHSFSQRAAKPADDAAAGRRTLMGATIPPPTMARRTLPPQQLAQAALSATMPAVLPTGAAAAAAAGGGSAYNPDLYSSVQNWQRHRQGSGNSGDGDPSDAVIGLAGSEAWGALPGHQQGATGQDASLAVEARSDSLLQWRLPKPRGSASQGSPQLAMTGTAAPAAVALPAPSLPAAQPPARIGSATFKRTLSSFKKKLFGGEGAEAGGQEQVLLDAQQDQQQTGGPGWSLAAVRPQAEPPASQEQQQPQQPAVQALVQERTWPARPSLAVVVPAADCQLGTCIEQPQPGAAESPTKGAADRLSRLKQMTERRRVWSAPSSPNRQQPSDGTAGADLGDGTLIEAEGNPAADVGQVAVQAVTGAADSGPNVRPGLQALKRARTARLSSITSLGAPPLTSAGSGNFQAYSMEAADELFGPDQPVGGSGLTAGSAGGRGLWSPLKSTGSGSFSSPGGTGGPRLSSLLLRSGASGSMQWPDSPQVPIPGSPSAAASWRAGGLPDSPTAAAASSPKASFISLEGSGGSGSGFSPAADGMPLAQPEAALQQVMSALQSAAVSQKKELDWQAQFEALRTVRRLALHHPAVLAPPVTLHALVVLAAPVVDALRSTMSRLAIAVFQGMVEALGPGMDAELDAFVPLLLKRAGQISISGRDNFLAVEADRALIAVVAHAGEARSCGSLLSCLASRSPDVRAKAAMHLDLWLQQHGPRLFGGAGGAGGGGAISGLGSATLIPRLLKAAVALLDEGGLEGRTAGKRMLWELRRLIDGAAAAGGGDTFGRALQRVDCKADKVLDMFESGRMPAAPARLPSATLRLPSAGSGPPSPTAGSYSPARPGSSISLAAGSTLTQAPRGSSAGMGGPSSLLNSMAGSRVSSAAPGGGITGAGGAAAASRQLGSRSGSLLAGSSGGLSGRSAGGDRGSTAGGGMRRGSRPGSAGVPGPAPSGSLAGLEPDMQHRLEAAQTKMGSPEWKVRLEGLEAVQACAASQAGALPVEAQLWLADALTQRAVDANLKVQQQALAVLNIVLDCAGPGLAPTAPALLPAICKCMDSGNPSVRQAAGGALDAVLRCWTADAHLPLLMNLLGSALGAARSKEALIDRLGGLVPSLWQSRPALVRQHVLPAVFSLLAAGRRPELRQLAQGALLMLARAVGSELVTAAAASPLLGDVQKQLVAEAAAATR